MKTVYVFGGTTEGRETACLLNKKGYNTKLFVATDLGGSIAREMGADFPVSEGRLDKNEMETVLSEDEPDLIIDATHPFAVEVTKNIKEVCQKLGIKCLRMVREDKIYPCAKYLNCIEDIKNIKLRKNILFTTGSKETGKIGDLKKDKSFYIRVLPTENSVQKALEEGFLKENIIKAQGPFSEEENICIIKKYDIKSLITKDSGKTGGLPEKVSAALKCSTDIYIIKKPKEEGLTFSEISKLINEGKL